MKFMDDDEEKDKLAQTFRAFSPILHGLNSALLFSYATLEK